MQAQIPLATYRFQLYRGFPLRDATALLPYLSQLGVSHVYCSPLLQAAPGSTHGYDCADHSRLNPEIASPAEFEVFAAKLKELGMSVLLDIVPNHAALHTTNPVLVDVLESGRASSFARFFDIDWSSARFDLAGRVLLPILGTHLSQAVEKGEVKLAWSDKLRTIGFNYFAWDVPVDPVTVARYLTRAGGIPLPEVLREPLDLLGKLPVHTAENEAPLRRAQLIARKAALAACVETNAEARTALGQLLKIPLTDSLKLLDQQPYRLACWTSAASEINYRRFFDINELIALRMEEADVFDFTHALPAQWLRRGIVTGLRVDHPDGLARPREYFERLQRLATGVSASTAAAAASASVGKPLYVLAEKILSPGEEWQREWATHGTTGYEFMNALTGVFVDTRAEHDFTRGWQQITGIGTTWQQMARKCKRLVLKRSFESDLARSAEALQALLLEMGPPLDWTLSQLRRALVEFVAALPVYRTYVAGDDGASDADAGFIHEALRLAAQRKGVERELLEAVARVFLVAPPQGAPGAERRARFVTQFQQMTGAVMAKGCEDTAFYRYLRLSALNEVGNDPGQFGTSLEAFHKHQLNRAAHWPAALSSVSTHDTKRGSDARLRLAALSELSGEWFRLLGEWSSLNAAHKSGGFPRANEEQFLYQTLLAVWEPESSAASEEFIGRIEAYMMKASKEAKVYTSWTEPDEAYETALKTFVRSVMAEPRFLATFVPFARRLHELMRLACVSHTVLHATLPGVPDVYQGTELWDLSLVDPDNRRPPNYPVRQEALARDLAAPSLLAAVAADKTGGLTKMWTLHRLLALRARLRDLFTHGNYTPAAVSGGAAERVVAFSRTHQRQELLVAVGRFFTKGAEASAFSDTVIQVAPGSAWRDWLSGASVAASEHGSLPVQQLFAAGPWAVLERA